MNRKHGKRTAGFWTLAACVTAVGMLMWAMPTMAKAADKPNILASLEGYPFQAGSSLSADGINYRSLKAMKILEQLKSGAFPVSR